jgi:hypothetical protein
MTILSLLAVTLYYAFSVGVQTWNRQQLRSQALERREKTFRYLERELQKAVPYSFQSKGGANQFFQGNESMLFYVTRSGFGARMRERGALYFACLSARAAQNGTLSLSLYKQPFPKTELLENHRDFTQRTKAQRQIFELEETLQTNSVTLLANIDAVTFAYHEKHIEPWSGVAVDASNATLPQDKTSSFTNAWFKEDPPGFVLVRFTIDGQTYAVQAPLSRMPQQASGQKNE